MDRYESYTFIVRHCILWQITVFLKSHNHKMALAWKLWLDSFSMCIMGLLGLVFPDRSVLYRRCQWVRPDAQLLSEWWHLPQHSRWIQLRVCEWLVRWWLQQEYRWLRWCRLPHRINVSWSRSVLFLRMPSWTHRSVFLYISLCVHTLCIFLGIYYCILLTISFPSNPGLLCHLDDACISNPCQKGSNCDTNPVNGKAICTCPTGYFGLACDQDVDECSLGNHFNTF